MDRRTDGWAIAARCACIVSCAKNFHQQKFSLRSIEATRIYTQIYQFNLLHSMLYAVTKNDAAEIWQELCLFFSFLRVCGCVVCYFLMLLSNVFFDE